MSCWINEKKHMGDIKTHQLMASGSRSIPHKSQPALTSRLRLVQFLLSTAETKAEVTARELFVRNLTKNGGPGMGLCHWRPWRQSFCRSAKLASSRLAPCVGFRHQMPHIVYAPSPDCKLIDSDWWPACQVLSTVFFCESIGPLQSN